METFPRLDSFMGSHFHQDYDLIADTIEDLIASFAATSSAAEVTALRADIAHFLQRHHNDIDGAFNSAYGFDFDPELWDLTAESFLRKVDALLADEKP